MRGLMIFVFFFQAEDGIRDLTVTGVQTCALPICPLSLAGVRVAKGGTAMSIASTSFRPARTVLRFVPHLGLLLAVIAVVLLALVPIGWRGGWWPYRFSLLSLMAYSAYFGIAAVIFSVLALAISVFGRSAIGRGGIAIAILALAAGGLTSYVPWHYRALARSVHAIDDITTDTDNPPAFVAVIKLREAELGNPSSYPGAETAALQRRGYPDLVPLSLALAPERAFPIALATAKKMSWTIVEADPTTRRIEASEQSFWMGFTDDIVVRVAAAGSGSRIDVRSASRHGRSDLGVNAARIRTDLAALNEAEKPGN